MVLCCSGFWCNFCCNVQIHQIQHNAVFQPSGKSALSLNNRCCNWQKPALNKHHRRKTCVWISQASCVLQSYGVWSTLGIVYRPRHWVSDAPFVPDVLGVCQTPEVHRQLVTLTQIHRLLRNNNNNKRSTTATTTTTRSAPPACHLDSDTQAPASQQQTFYYYYYYYNKKCTASLSPWLRYAGSCVTTTTNVLLLLQLHYYNKKCTTSLSPWCSGYCVATTSVQQLLLQVHHQLVTLT